MRRRDRPKRTVPRKQVLSIDDTFALDQFKKLIDHQIDKIYKSKLTGNPIDPLDIETLDRWMSEFKKIGGI